MENVLVADGLQKSYGETVALRDVSLSVGAGEVVALIGPNGAGKTTLVRSLTGTTSPDAGSATILGQPPAEVDKSRISLLPQEFSPPERLTVRELVAYYAGLYPDPRDLDAVLSDVGLADDADTRYDALSGGQKRRVCVGTSLVNDPDVLFLDEPTTGIDPAGRQSLWRLLENLAASGTTIFLTTHYMAEAERLADRVGLLADGELVEVGSPADLIREYGGESRLIVETDDAKRATEFSFAVETEDGELVFPDIEPVEISDVIAELDDRQVAYDALTWTQPDLEDVYLRLTGQSFDATATTDRSNERIPAGGDRQ